MQTRPLVFQTNKKLDRIFFWSTGLVYSRSRTLWMKIYFVYNPFIEMYAYISRTFTQQFIMYTYYGHTYVKRMLIEAIYLHNWRWVLYFKGLTIWHVLSYYYDVRFLFMLSIVLFVYLFWMWNSKIILKYLELNVLSASSQIFWTYKRLHWKR